MELSIKLSRKSCQNVNNEIYNELINLIEPLARPKCLFAEWLTLINDWLIALT